VLAAALHQLDALAIDGYGRAEAHLALAAIARRRGDCATAGEHVAQARALLARRESVFAYLRREQAAQEQAQAADCTR
jgi:hypothetical protein